MVRALITKLIRMAGRKRDRFRERNLDEKKMDKESEKLDKLETRMEKVADKMIKETEELEGIKSGMRKKHQFSIFSGELTILTLQDFIGAAFGGLFFAVTQEIWELSARLALPNIIAISLASFLMGLSLIYFSRRRKLISIRIFHTSVVRAVEIYIISLITSIMLITMFSTAPSFILMLKQTVVVTFPAVITAATADLLFY
ncbi:MAG: DUF2391 family protein [Candidatus Aenigmarchaeota archaeon]|nr:DUF2391 family protein [Candidatus Aenigmarchaeota archaeon]